MNSILHVTVSCFKDYQTPDNPKDVDLLAWLRSEKYHAAVEQIRSIKDKEHRDQLKATLPAVTPSGKFNYRNADSLVRHSSFLQFDIDLKENQHIKNYSSLKDQLCNIVNVAYCGLSASGLGYWGVIPISYPEQHKAHFEALKRDFAKYGIAIDEKPKNVASLRGYSWDADAYFNHNAKVYTKTWKPEKRQREYVPTDCNGSDTRQRVEQLIQQIQSLHLDITASYATWFELGCSLANEFGEGGREYFHLISQYHPQYKETATDKQFSHCLKHNYQFKINTFFHHSKLSGIKYEPNLQKPVAREAAPGVCADNSSRQRYPEHKPFSQRITYSESYLEEMATAGTPF